MRLDKYFTVSEDSWKITEIFSSAGLSAAVSASFQGSVFVRAL